MESSKKILEIYSENHYDAEKKEMIFGLWTEDQKQSFERNPEQGRFS